MRRVTIIDKDPDGFVAVHLCDILNLVGQDALESQWTLSAVEVEPSPGAERIREIAESGGRIRGIDLAASLRRTIQIVDGQFAAYRGRDERPWLIIEAVDSSAYDVETDDERILSALKARYREVKDIS